MTSLQVIIASTRSVGWGSNETVKLLCLVPWPSTLTYGVKTGDSNQLYTPLAGQTIHTAANFMLPLLSLRSLSICQALLLVTYVVIYIARFENIWRCLVTYIFRCLRLFHLPIHRSLTLKPVYMPSCKVLREWPHFSLPSGFQLIIIFHNCVWSILST